VRENSTQGSEGVESREAVLYLYQTLRIVRSLTSMVLDTLLDGRDELLDIVETVFQHSTRSGSNLAFHWFLKRMIDSFCLTLTFHQPIPNILKKLEYF
jgi:hypothetical protein